MTPRAPTTPSLTHEDIVGTIASEHYFTAAQGVIGAAIHDTPDGVDTLQVDCPRALARVTICALTLRNGFVVLGQCADTTPENFDAQTRRELARADALKQVWQLESYRHAATQTLSTEADE